MHVDSFLYEDDEAIDELCEKGKMSRSYCVECGSHNTKPLSTYMTPRHLNVASHAYTQLDYITHSASLSQLRFIFGPRVLGDIPNQVLVDVGSRLGAVLYTVCDTLGRYIITGDLCSFIGTSNDKGIQINRH